MKIHTRNLYALCKYLLSIERLCGVHKASSNETGSGIILGEDIEVTKIVPIGVMAVFP
jgi:hypothetical protein